LVIFEETFIKINLRKIFQRYLRALIVALSIRQIYKNSLMKQSVLVVTTVILLLGGVVTVALIQSVEASGVNTTRSNIKSSGAMKKKEVKGKDNQLSTQEVIINQIYNPVNKCGDRSDCSNSATFEIGGISAGGATSDQSAVFGDTTVSIDGDSNSVSNVLKTKLIFVSLSLY
jgi:hypothetical protein